VQKTTISHSRSLIMKRQFKHNRVPVHGVLLLDKPEGVSSTYALGVAKRLLNAEKAGHTGTLDPFATGLLPLCFGEATKFAQDLLHADKIYEATVHLGVTTTTADTEGDIVETKSVDLTPEQIELVLQQFRGEIKQVPPMHSALKRDGKPLYEYAREGVVLERDAREVLIHALELIEFKSPYLKIRVHCSKGTYIRVLGEDIGLALGCGAHLIALRRTGVGALDLDRSITLAEFTELAVADQSKTLLPVDALLVSLPAIRLSEELTQRFLHGQRLPGMVCEEAHPTDEVDALVRVYRAVDDVLLGVALLDVRSVLSPQRLVSVSAT
jgi:tRNA pseudouridine55 synthase